MSSFALDRIPNFQSTLQHEIAHTCGLPHVDVYGYGMKTSRSIMAYNPAHKTKGFQPAREPGILIPEDRRGLALCTRMFAKLKFDANRDLPENYSSFSELFHWGRWTCRAIPLMSRCSRLRRAKTMAV